MAATPPWTHTCARSYFPCWTKTDPCHFGVPPWGLLLCFANDFQGLEPLLLPQSGAVRMAFQNQRLRPLGTHPGSSLPRGWRLVFIGYSYPLPSRVLEIQDTGCVLDPRFVTDLAGKVLTCGRGSFVQGLDALQLAAELVLAGVCCLLPGPLLSASAVC